MINFTPTLVAAGAYFLFVFFKAFQQRNVAFDHYFWVMPLSYLMSTTEVIVISMVAIDATNANNWTDMIPILIGVGTGGGIGALLAMYLHKKYLTKAPE